MIKRPATIQAELRYRVEIRSLRRRRTDCGPSCPRYASAQTALLGRRKTSCLKGWALSPSILSDRRRSPRPTAPQMPRHRLRSIAFDSINSKHALGAPRCWRATVSLQQSHKVGSSRVQSESKPKRLAADTAYGTGRFLGWLVGHGIAPHIPVRNASERDDGTFARSDFRWDKRRRVYICPNNKVLHTIGTVDDGTMLRDRASKFDCDVCPLENAVLSKHDRATGAPRYP